MMISYLLRLTQDDSFKKSSSRNLISVFNCRAFSSAIAKACWLISTEVIYVLDFSFLMVMGMRSKGGFVSRPVSKCQ